MAFLSLVLPSRTISRVTFGLGMGLLALEILFSTLSAEAISLSEAVGWQGLRLGVLTIIPATWLLFSLVYARGNRCEFLSRWWPGLAVALVLPVAVVLLMPGQYLTVVATTPEQTGLWFGLDSKGLLLEGLMLCSYVLVLVNLERTFQASVGVMRWRIKFVIVGLGLLFVMRIYTSSQKLLYHGWQSSLDELQALALLAAGFLIVWSAVRCGLAEADVYPSRTVIFGSVTFSLVGIYLLLVGILAKGVSIWGGAGAVPLGAMVFLAGLGVLGVFLVSDRARLWLGLMLARHFHRPIYDHRDIWQRFTERTVSVVDPVVLCGVACSFISDVFQTLSVTLWTVKQGTRQVEFGGSTTLNEDQAKDLIPSSPLSDDTWSQLNKIGRLIDVDVTSAQELQVLCPEQFEHKGGKRFILPLLAAGKLVGLLVLGDRVNARPYTLEERDLLHTLGLEIATLLLNLSLLQKRSEAREAEALRTMSSFFAHDLKNTSSTLSLTLQNLRKHFGNPDFREDALRGVSKCVEHINHIVGGLSTLQMELKLARQTLDLNDVVRQVIAEMDAALGLKVGLDLRPLPRTALDEEQIKKVLINMLLNARDAVSVDGRVDLRTGTDGRWIWLKVSDNGRGMKTDFLRRSLFRPFQTTKKSGLGIGMFQSKMIVESHGGRIEVESQVDVGTTFLVLLPLKESSE
jgi:hypothetical protein